MKRSLRKRMEPVFYLLPALLFFIVFTYYPFVKTIYSSFFLCNSMGEVREFIGAENYVRIFHDPLFLAAVKNTFIYVIVSVPTAILIALALALLANRRTRTSSIYETMFALTMAMSTSVVAMIFQLMYNPSIGILNEVLHTKLRWLTDPDLALFSIAFISIWMNIGFNFLFLLAAIRSVPGELLECAELEGATGLKKTTHVILPIISPTMFFLVCNAMARSMMMSGLVIILTDGGRKGTASTMISYMYSQAVLAQNYNNGYAAAVVAFVITFALLLVSFMNEKRTVNYD